jgi:hypothetical protein
VLAKESKLLTAGGGLRLGSRACAGLGLRLDGGRRDRADRRGPLDRLFVPPPRTCGAADEQHTEERRHGEAARRDARRSEQRGAIEELRRFLHTCALVIREEDIVRRLAGERRVLAQVTLDEDRRAERREVIALEGLDEPVIEAQRVRHLDERQSLAFARGAQASAWGGCVVRVRCSVLLSRIRHQPLDSARRRASSEFGNSCWRRCA